MSAMTELKIHGLRVAARLGVHAWEQEAPRQFPLEVTLRYDAAAAVQEDDFSQAVDYAAVEEELMRFAAARSWRLIETLAQESALHLLKHFPPLEEVVMTVTKPQALRFADAVSATVHLQRKDLP